MQVVDIYTLYNQILEKPAAYGFDPSLAKTPCYSGSYSAVDGTVCEDASKRILYDQIHPSHASHRIIARTFQDALEKL